jgi:hypothetical protein
MQRGLDDLVAWVEGGEEAAGENVAGDLAEAGRAFTMYPRLGDDGADEVTGASERVTLRGTITRDGEPIEEGFLWAIVRHDGVQRACSFAPWPWISHGEYEMVIAAESETAGCGAPGAELYMSLFQDGTQFLSTPIAWPTGSEAEMNVDFLSTAALDQAEGPRRSDNFGTVFFGTAFDADRAPVPVGTVIEAYVGETLCGRYQVPPVPMVFDEPGTYGIDVAAPALNAACALGETVTFRIDGELAPETGEHDGEGHLLLLLSAP